MHDTAEDNGLTDLSKNKRRLLTPLPPFSSSGRKQKLEIDRKWWNNNPRYESHDRDLFSSSLTTLVFRWQQKQVCNAFWFKPFPFFHFLIFVVVVCMSSPVSFITMQINAWYVAISLKNRRFDGKGVTKTDVGGHPKRGWYVFMRSQNYGTFFADRFQDISC